MAASSTDWELQTNSSTSREQIMLFGAANILLVALRVRLRCFRREATPADGLPAGRHHRLDPALATWGSKTTVPLSNLRVCPAALVRQFQLRRRPLLAGVSMKLVGMITGMAALGWSFYRWSHAAGHGEGNKKAGRGPAENNATSQLRKQAGGQQVVDGVALDVDCRHEPGGKVALVLDGMIATMRIALVSDTPLPNWDSGPRRRTGRVPHTGMHQAGSTVSTGARRRFLHAMKLRR